MDFADALHLRLAGEWERFPTVDKNLVKTAKSAGASDAPPVVGMP
jgi:hypothetical protein